MYLFSDLTWPHGYSLSLYSQKKTRRPKKTFIAWFKTLVLLEEHGAIVKSIACDGAATNKKMCISGCTLPYRRSQCHSQQYNEASKNEGDDILYERCSQSHKMHPQ
jgi:hypothetical protein